MKQYDYVILGAGASGLSLACHLADSPLRNSSILLVERSLHEHANRTWAFWEKAGSVMPFDGVPLHSWRRLLVAGPHHTLILRTRPYRYRAIRSCEFYPYAHKRLSAFPNIQFLEGEVGVVEEGPGGAVIPVGGEQYQGRWVFDSRFELTDFHPGPRYHFLRMQVRGWEIVTDTPSFDLQTATFLDFRTPQPSRHREPAEQRHLPETRSTKLGGSRFVYVLPYSAGHALVEHVACVPAGDRLMHQEEEEAVLRNYIERTLGVTEYRIVREEDGTNPMSNYPFPRRRSQHVMSIGIAGGMLKPSTGFAFARIQRDSAAIVRSLQAHGHPFDVRPTQWPYRLTEPLMLWAMAWDGKKVGSLLGALFRVGRTHKILSFLDEQGMPV